MRRLILMALLALAGMAVAAAPSLAAPPNGDTEADNWSAITAIYYESGDYKLCDTATRCRFSDAATWTFKQGATSEACDGIWRGHMDTSGNTNFTEVYTGTGCSVEPKAPFPWTGKACYHEPSEQYWLRQTVRLGNASWTTYGQVTGTPSSLNTSAPTVWLDGVKFGNPASNAFTPIYDDQFGFPVLWGEHHANFSDGWRAGGSGTGILAGPSGSACGWSDLS